VNGIAKSAYEMLIMIRAAFFTKNDLVGLCTKIYTPKPDDDDLQPFLEGFKC
jgi:hypothetical protein